MHIWMLNHYAVPLDGSGGTRHASLAKYLQQAGHQVTIFASAVPHGQGKAVEVPDGAHYMDRLYDGVRFRFVRTTPYANAVQRFINMLSYRESVCRAAGDLAAPDIVIGSSVHLHAADAGFRLARRYGVPFIFEVRDIWPESLIDIGAISQRHPIYWLLRRLELHLYRQADRVMTLLPGMITYLERQGVPAERVWYLPNGIDTDFYGSIVPPPPADPFVATFMGAHGPANGLEFVIEAASRLQNDPCGSGIRIRLIGDGPSKPGLQQLAASSGLRNIEFLAPVPKRELITLAQQSHAFIFHLREMPVLEHFGVSPNKLFDYLMLGRPVVFACRSYNDPIAKTQAGISVPPEDSTALAEALLALRDLSPEERAAMGERGQAWVLQHHDMRALAGQLGEWLEALVAEKSPHHTPPIPAEAH